MEKIVYQCPNSCEKYSKSIDEIFQAGKKHKETLMTVIELSEKQKLKISSLREEKNNLLDQVDQLEHDKKSDSDLILRMTKENRELKRELKDHRMKAIEQEELVRELKHESEVNHTFAVKLRDLEDEIFMKDDKISELETKVGKSKVAHENIDFEMKSIEKQNKQLKDHVKTLEAKINTIKENELTNKMKRNDLLQTIDANMESRKIYIENLKTKLNKLKQRRAADCWYGIECTRMFCKFSHGFIFTKDNRKFIHQVVESPSAFLCEHCGEMFENSETHMKHLHSNHEKKRAEIKILHCAECSFNFETRDDLNSHVIQHHDSADIECERCGKFFASRNELNDHRRTHKSVDMEIESLNNMLKNLVDKDTETSNNPVDADKSPKTDNPFKCKECSETFKTTTSLKKHRETVHKVEDVTIQEENDPFKNNPNRKLECGLCVLDFESIQKMDKHMDDKHSGRWKLGDPDVVFEGDDYEESESDDFEDGYESESSESHSGGD